MYGKGHSGSGITLQELHDQWGSYIQQELERSTAGPFALVARMFESHNVTVSVKNMCTYVEKVRNNDMEDFH